jgi:hypothetical protein
MSRFIPNLAPSYNNLQLPSESPLIIKEKFKIKSKSKFDYSILAIFISLIIFLIIIFYLKKSK